MRYVFIVLLVCFGIAWGQTSAVYASTDTPTPSPTATSTSTPTTFLTPEVNQFWTEPAVTDEAGTEIAPAQAVAFSNSQDAGDVGIQVLAGLILFSFWLMFIIWAVFVRRLNN